MDILHQNTRKFTPSSRRNPCQLCGDTKGKCRSFPDQDLVLCMELREPPPGWKFAGETKDGLWAKFWPIDPNWKPSAEPKRWEPKPETKTIVSDSQKDKAYQRILEVGTLNDRHIADFTRRGLTDAEIGFLEAVTRSVPTGYLIPFPNADDQWCGAQIRRDDTEGGRYRWHYYQNNISLNNEFSEKPLAVWKHGEPVWIVEGTGVKPIVASIRHGITAIGAAGGLHHISPKTLAYTLERLGNPASVVLCPDAGDIQNQQVMSRIRRNVEALEPLGVQVTIAWWNQKTKADQDIDQLPNLDGVRFLTPKEFWSMVGTAPDTAADTPPAPVKLDRESVIRLRILKPFGNRSYDFEFKSRADLEAYYRTLTPGSMVMVDAPTGSGKTQASREKGQGAHTIAVSPSRALGRGLANTLQMPFLNDCQGIPDRTAVVINSLQKIPTLGHTLLLGEIDQIHYSLVLGKTNQKDRHAKTQDYAQKIRTAQIAIADSATATLEDLELEEAIKGHRIPLIKYVPDHGHRKGGAVLFTGQKDKAGSNKAAQVQFFERLDTEINKGNRTILATDTKAETIRLKHHLQGLGVDPESILVINADTRATDPRVNSFLSSPNPGLWLSQRQDVRHVIYNSTMPSGVSIIDPDTENPLFQFYGGYFTGSVISPAVCCQMLSRYRTGCDRVVFVARAGRYTPAVANWNRKAQARKYRDRVRESMTMNALDRDTEIRKSLGGIGFGTLTQDPFSEYAMATASRLCDEYQYFAVSLQAYLERDGFTAELVRCEPLEDSQIKSYRDEVNHEKADPIVKARPIDSTEHRMIRELPEPSHEQLCQADGYEVRKFHGMTWDEPLNHDLVIAERFGAGRREHRKLMMWLIGGLAEESDRNRLESLGSHYYAHDLSHHTAALQNLERFGVLDALDYCLNNIYSSRDAYLRQVYDRLQEHRGELERIKTLGAYLPYATGDGDDRYRGLCQFFGELLRKIGIKTESARHRCEDGSIIRVYQATPGSVEEARERVERHWQALRHKGYSPRSTPLLKIFLPGVDHLAKNEGGDLLAAKLEAMLSAEEPDWDAITLLTERIYPVKAA